MTALARFPAGCGRDAHAFAELDQAGTRSLDLRCRLELAITGAYHHLGWLATDAARDAALTERS